MGLAFARKGCPMLPQRRSRIAILALTLLVVAGRCPSARAENDPIPHDPQPQAHETRRLPDSWVVTGDNPKEYACGLDDTVTYHGTPSGFIRSVGFNLDGFGTLTSVRRAEPYRGKTIRLSAVIKTDKVQNWTGMWLRADCPGRMAAAFVSMEETHKLSGTTDWQRYALTLTVPADATYLPFGLAMVGRGAAYINAVEIDVVPDASPPPSARPRADFER